MKERYMIVMVEDGIRSTNGCSIVGPCYKIHSKGYETLKEAYKVYNVMKKYSDPDSYIIVKYWC